MTIFGWLLLIVWICAALIAMFGGEKEHNFAQKVLIALYIVTTVICSAGPVGREWMFK